MRLILPTWEITCVVSILFMQTEHDIHFFYTSKIKIKSSHKSSIRNSSLPKIHMVSRAKKILLFFILLNDTFFVLRNTIITILLTSTGGAKLEWISQGSQLWHFFFFGRYGKKASWIKSGSKVFELIMFTEPLFLSVKFYPRVLLLIGITFAITNGI